MRILRIILIGFVLLLIGVTFFFYTQNYSEGIRSGKVLKISKKGIIFKTYEGQLNTETFGARSNNPALPGQIISQIFDFSVQGNREDVVKELQAVALTGEHVNLHYEEKFIRLPWWGDTKYFIVKVERLQTP